jgi:glutathione reductase (NADPH)
MSYDVDLFVIGGGSGGVRAARIAASLGARVALCEEGAYGGTCVNVGCVPKKLLVYGAAVAHQLRLAPSFGWQIDGARFDWGTLIENKDREITRLSAIYASLLDRAGVRRIDGRGHLVDAHTVEVGGQRFTAETVMIATGGRPVVPDIPGSELGIVSDAVFSLPELPRRLVVVGGGFIGLEFACIFRALGSEVCVVQRAPHLLRGFDVETSDFLGDQLRQRGIGIHLETVITGLRPGEHGIRVSYDRPGPAPEADVVLFAAGRTPNSKGMGLEQAGVELGEWDQIVVDAEMRSSVPNIYAVGDVVGHRALTPVALEEGMAVARRLYGEGSPALDYDLVAMTVFSQPALSCVGLSEERAREEYQDVVIYKTSFRPMRVSLSDAQDRVFVKVIVDGASDRVLGFHLVGSDAGEVVQGLAVALQCGVTKQLLDTTVGIHPTLAEEFVTLRTPA